MTAAYDAVLFDLDGVLTSTATLHASCWKQVFDDALADWTAPRAGEPQEPFWPRPTTSPTSTASPATTGVRDFLAARGVDGDVDAIADRKQALVERALDEGGRGRRSRARCAWVLASAPRPRPHRRRVLQRQRPRRPARRRHRRLFDLTVDGHDIVELGPARQARARRLSRGGPPPRGAARPEPWWSRTRSPASPRAAPAASAW